MRPLAMLLIAMVAAGCVGAGTQQAEIVPPHVALLGPTFPHVVIEAYHVPGYAPFSETLDLLERRISETTGKTVVAVNQTSLDDRDATNRRDWTGGDVVSLAHRHQVGGLAAPQVAAGDTVHVIVYFLAGSFVDTNSDENLGVVSSNRAFVFRNSTSNPTMSTTQIQRAFLPQAIEATTAIHEYGHLLGLVNLGVPMVTPHEDPQSRGHSSDDDSVMGRGALATISAEHESKVGYYDDFNDHDREDLAAFRASLRK